jgi:hypothetical protein
MHTYLLVAGDRKIPEMLEPFADYDGEGNNPDARFDWFEIGGRFAAALPLKNPRRLRRFFGLLPAGFTSNATAARKSEVDHEALLADPPAALLFRGQWLSSPIVLEGRLPEAWRSQFASAFAQIPDETLLTIVDCHS